MPENIYDQIPYPTQPIRASHPENIAAIALLCGLSPASCSTAKVLEIGCGTGENLIALASYYPSGTFAGVDLAPGAISKARTNAGKAELTNIKFIEQDILDLRANIERYDYIICHGIFSWISDAARNKLLAGVSSLLADNGIAYISFNCLPGWYRRGYARDLMQAELKGKHPQPGELGDARAAIVRAAKILSLNEASWAKSLMEELQTAADKPDWYLIHDYLAPHNKAFYFTEFADLALAAGLKYVADAEITKILPQETTLEARKLIMEDLTSTYDLENRMDIYRNTMFRRAILSKQAPTPHRKFSHDAVLKYEIASSLKIHGEQASASSQENVRFGHRHGGALEVASPDLKLALQIVSDLWPATIRFEELSDRTVKAAAKLKITLPPDFSQKLKSLLLRGFLAGLLDFTVEKPPITVAVPEKPRTTPAVRSSALVQGEVQNLRCENIDITAEEAQVLRLLDGTRDVTELAKLTSQSKEATALILAELLRKCFLI